MSKSKKKSPTQQQSSPKKPQQTITKKHPKSVFQTSPVYDLLHYFERAPDQWTARYILVLSAVILRTAVGLGGHSGYHTPPMFGDFEAQRHWMELTIHLPISEWYFFDLQYWGLDYPVLTAYHSYICGVIGNFINPNWFALNDSRGLETDDLRMFMRLTAIASELIIYIPGILKLANLLGKKSNINRMDQIIIALIIINQPHLVLIDHGHFQFNSVMLGFFIYSIIDLVKGNLVLASIWFVSCINFKQMGLYYSLFIFFYILSQIRSLLKLVLVGFTVVLTQFIYLLPFIWYHPQSVLQILIRVFPFNRGLFEDKVANFWCTTNIIVKHREIIDSAQLSKLALIATLAATVPINIYLFIKIIRKPDVKIAAMIYGFTSNALSFYLFSYQVHEKSILIALVPISLLLLINPHDITMVQFINTVGTFSLYPLLKKDDLVLQYFVLSLVINWLIGKDLVFNKAVGTLNCLVIASTYIAIGVYHIIDFSLDPPARYPDLWVILNTAIAFGAFSYFWLWLVYRIYKL
ncbi:Dolichyl pyrophosphate Man9GlcNAc2 alpha-1,3-glucosyltransferase [Candida viswanathii]|uniref:Alpha-1,3-glucosyltransferase n=1 Tax=Candida viswanathii TaxID=5486 RepID=A0A367Y1S4_9ASCO|nr:Dolichyl pyrophosphate Man9GlcNAc2 alpha-1,3-glucosyltransferase [Candida viswanathii]